ncbi:MAG: peptidylprolyl isomerase [Pseudomonadales bacterium]|nr:peptidylprolyl isomerase [Pseudomonadales bacterium]
MNRIVLLLLLLLGAGLVQAENPEVLIKTTMGDIVLELDQTRAPVTVGNFLSYVEDGSYVNTVFHRVIPGFMIQGGGHLADMTEVSERAEIRNEADNGLRNLTGTIAMARMDIIDSAGRQFFINVNDNAFLDHSPQSCSREDEAAEQAALERGLRKPRTCKSFGYAVFGRVIRGMDVVHKIEVVETGVNGSHMDVPVEPVTITAVELIKP